MEKKYLIFDLDWTLIDSSLWWTNHAVKRVKKIDKNLEDKARYIFESTPWLDIYKQLNIIFEDENIDNNRIREIWDDIYKSLRKNFYINFIQKPQNCPDRTARWFNFNIIFLLYVFELPFICRLLKKFPPPPPP